jgi:signal transduction histidine kinase
MNEHEPLEPLEGADASGASRAVETLGRLTGAVAHEFKNLLLVIMGLTDLVLNRTDLERTARRDLEEIRRATEQADELTHRLFALVRKPAAKPRPVLPNALLRSLERLLGRLLGEKIALRVELADGLGSVRVDPVEFEQSLLNLVLNARDALPQGGEIRIATGRVELAPGTPGSLPAGRYVALRVSDDGTGMDEATRARLFEPFFTTKEPGRGSGLGLSLVRAFVTRAGGEVHVRSGLGAGTTVELLLPELEVPAPEAVS